MLLLTCRLSSPERECCGFLSLTDCIVLLLILAKKGVLVGKELLHVGEVPLLMGTLVIYDETTGGFKSEDLVLEVFALEGCLEMLL